MRLIPVLVSIFVLVFAVGIYRYEQPLPALAVTQLLTESTTPMPGQANLPWPTKGSAAVAVDNLGVVASMGDDKPRPIASVTKMMTAYLILKAHPLKIGETGPILTVTQDDVRTYNRLISQDESVVGVREGTKISQYDLLQGLLIPSANNYALMLAAWDSGSTDAFVAKMNDTAKSMGMKNTKYVDPSGVSAAGISTASDQLILVQMAMANPVFAEIVAKKQASVPVAGTIYSTDTSLGKQGIIGAKTGWTEEAGGCFVFAAQTNIDGRAVMVYGAVIGQDSLDIALLASERLVPAIATNLKFAKVIVPNTPAATIVSEWGEKTQAVIDGEVELLAWPGLVVRTGVMLDPLGVPVKAGADLGGLRVQFGDQTRDLRLKADKTLHGPTKAWKIFR
jgi:D-alanyl-D-alanine carboxypeptidase (penicillin-binding protein 5/6)